jgi:hypothetical protein
MFFKIKEKNLNVGANVSMIYLEKPLLKISSLIFSKKLINF